MHYGFFGEHYSGSTTIAKVLQAGYYWPTIFKDSFKIVSEYEKCNRYVGKRRHSTMPLNPIVVEEPFQQWGLDFIGVINPNSLAGQKFIFTATYYFTRWSEAMPCKNEDQEAVIEMIKRIITQFDIP